MRSAALAGVIFFAILSTSGATHAQPSGPPAEAPAATPAPHADPKVAPPPPPPATTPPPAPSAPPPAASPSPPPAIQPLQPAIQPLQPAIQPLAPKPIGGAPPPPRYVKPEPNYSHRLQFGLGVTAGSGYRVVFKYGEATTCGELDDQGKSKNVCTSRLPTWLDAKILFGVSTSLDLVVEQRFGMENDTITQNRQFMIMPGIRYYPTPNSKFKFFVQIQLALEFGDPGATTSKRLDFGIHEVNGFQWDFIRWMGVYLQISETFAFYRSFDFQLEGGLGLEARFP